VAKIRALFKGNQAGCCRRLNSICCRTRRSLDLGKRLRSPFVEERFRRRPARSKPSRAPTWPVLRLFVADSSASIRFQGWRRRRQQQTGDWRGSRDCGCARDQFLSSSTFAGYQHRGIEIGNAAHQLINALIAGWTDELIATGEVLDAMVHGLELLLERGVFTGPAEHGLEFADRWGAAAVAEGSVADQLECGGTKVIVAITTDGTLDSIKWRETSMRSCTESRLEFRSRIMTSHFLASHKAIHRLGTDSSQDLLFLARAEERSGCNRRSPCTADLDHELANPLSLAWIHDSPDQEAATYPHDPESTATMPMAVLMRCRSYTGNALNRDHP